MSVRNIPIAVRAHTENQKPSQSNHAKKDITDLRKPYGKRVLVFDTETTTDIYMNLLFGQAMIFEGSTQAHIDGCLKEHYLFYGDNLSSDHMTLLSRFTKAKGLTLISKQEFINEIFIPEIWELGSVCVGFNLPFDLSRIASCTRTFSKGKHRNRFELILTDNKYKPTILVEPIDSKKAFISFRFPTRQKTSSVRIPFRQGRFIDLRTLVFALTNESHSLDSACKLYQVKHGKGHAEQHGIITPQYIEYNRKDVEATWGLYCNAKEEFDRHPLAIEAGKAYSPATIGKAYYKAMNIRPFDKKQPDFPKEIFGYAMVAYYGGRSECHFRREPVEVFHTDITSMYPSVFTLQNLWSWVIAGHLQVIESTEEVKSFLEDIKPEMLFEKDFWTSIPGLVQIVSDHDLLPVRAEYGKANGYQIGLNYLTCDKPMWYTLADIIASKILTGNIPKIIRALRIIPGEAQEDLNIVHIRGQIPIDPKKDNFFKKVIELRKEYKKKVAQKGDEADSMQLFLKILANSTSYGVYIEMNREEFEQEQDIEVYGLDNFKYINKNVDINGNYYNPLIAVMITGAARLILAMMEKTVYDLGGNFAFCDTDSMSIIDLNNGQPEVIGRQVVDRFKSLYPYDDDSKVNGASLLEAEDYNWQRIDWEKDTDKNNIIKNQYFPLHCYMVSAKRYVLYNLIKDPYNNIQIIIRKKSDHGLGHLKSPIEGKDKNDWVNEVWKWIISNEHNLPYEEPDWFYTPAFAQLSISKPTIYNILNRDKNFDYSQQIKPFNFMLVAYPVEDKIFRGEIINRYYCRLHRAIGSGECHNKSKCNHAYVCFANLHMIPVAPYDNKLINWPSFRWLEKNTKQPIDIKLNRSMSESAQSKYLEQQLESITEAEKIEAIVHLNKSINNDEYIFANCGEMRVKSYYDFIKEYALHPELKYDDCYGNPCGKGTKGLLNRTHVNTLIIKHIGKETNTLQDKEEEVIIPDEANWDNSILTYENNPSMEISKFKIDCEQWQDLRLTLKAQAKPRKTWASNIGISLDYFKQLLAGIRQPSAQLFDLIIEECKRADMKLPQGKKPKPKGFEEKNVYPMRELALNYNIPIEEIRASLNSSVFTLYGVEYIGMSEPFVEKYFSQCRELKRQERKKQELHAMCELKVYGKCLNGSERQIQSFDMNQITYYQVSHEVGRSYKTINVKLKNGSIYQVLQRDNPLIFKYGLLPKPSKLPFNNNKRTVTKQNGYTTEYGQWQPYSNVPSLNEKQLLNLYGLSRKTINHLIKENAFPADACNIIEGSLTVNPLIVYRWFLKSAA